jgi:neutral ceramidase
VSQNAYTGLRAGAATADATPRDSQFLYGYPHVKRYSDGVHDRLLSSALLLDDGRTKVMLIANDVIFVSKRLAARVRSRVEAATGVAAANVMVTATHTHSGPITVDMISGEADPAVPKADPAYLDLLEDAAVAAACRAAQAARPAEIALAVADGSRVGTNRHDPCGPRDPQAPVLAVREAGSGRLIALSMVCCMHPTVLHEDSTLISGDFPAMARQHIQRSLSQPDLVVLHHTGPAGNQSPRHVTRGNTFAEAERLGAGLGQAVLDVMAKMDFRPQAKLACRSTLVDLPRRQMSSVADAERQEADARRRLEAIRAAGASRAERRTAECDWFGAQETLALARAAAGGALAAAYDSILPAEIMLVRIGPWSLVAWPGEAFVEFGLQVKARRKDCFVIALANGELQGYLVTTQAIRERWYEAGNSILASPAAGERLVAASLKLLEEDAAAPQ